jgi:hypothetical protein
MKYNVQNGRLRLLYFTTFISDYTDLASMVCITTEWRNVKDVKRSGHGTTKTSSRRLLRRTEVTHEKSERITEIRTGILPSVNLGKCDYSVLLRMNYDEIISRPIQVFRASKHTKSVLALGRPALEIPVIRTFIMKGVPIVWLIIRRRTHLSEIFQTKSIPRKDLSNRKNDEHNKTVYFSTTVYRRLPVQHSK